MKKGGLVHAPFKKAIWKDRHVLILGLGQYPKGSGIAAALTFARLGSKVTVTDLKTANELKDNVARLKKFKNVRFVLGRHDLDDVRQAEFIVPNQRVRQSSPEIKLARKLGTPIQTEIALFLNRCPAKVIGITGTRGKSTTTALIAHILRQGVGASGRRIWLGGNILVSPLTFLSKIKKNDLVVLELSSFQTESLAEAKPVDIAVITNLKRDHLNAYADMEEYAEAKAQIFRYQKPNQFVILNADDAYGERWMNEAPSRVQLFSKHDALPIKTEDLLILGEHNAMNARAAVLAVKAAGASESIIKKGLKTFKGLENRLEKIRVWRGINFINDTTATTPDGTIAAINALQSGHRHLWIICGGADKELDYAEFGVVAKKYQPHLHFIMLPGDASLKMYEALLHAKEHTHPVKDLREAVDIAASHAIKGDAVVLSPGAASFNQFKNEFDRGEQFNTLVKKLKG
jgi:UDP-N-acetylmuramoylalanine--D-glutamate ligase